MVIKIAALIFMILLISCDPNIEIEDPDNLTPTSEFIISDPLLKSKDIYTFSDCYVGFPLSFVKFEVNLKKYNLKFKGNPNVKIEGTDADCFEIIQPDEKGVFSIRFNPKSEGFKNAYLSIENNSIPKEFILYLSGNGQKSSVENSIIDQSYWNSHTELLNTIVNKNEIFVFFKKNSEVYLSRKDISSDNWISTKIIEKDNICPKLLNKFSDKYYFIDDHYNGSYLYFSFDME